MNNDQKIILFDGVCNLCSAFFSFVYLYEKNPVLRFGWIQSEEAKDLLKLHNLPVDKMDTIIFIEDDQSYIKSEAVIKISKYLKFPWCLLKTGVILPRFVRDSIYDFVARNRYNWFGKKDSCLIPTGDLKKRFI